MRHWDVPIAFKAQERNVVKRLHRMGKFSVFLRESRHERCDARGEAEVAKAYKQPRGPPRIPRLSWPG
jgi:hypothetical protein